MTGSSLVRRGISVAVPLSVAGAVVVLAAAPALAATSLSVRADGASLDGSTLRDNTTIQVVGSDTAPDRTGLSRSRTLSLSVDRPDAGRYQLAPQQTVRSNVNGSINGSLDTTCAPWASPCADVVNGNYVFIFSDGSTTRTATVAVEVPPAEPGGFTAAADGSVATFSWRPNTEPDLVGYDIVDGSGDDVTPGGMDRRSVCDSGGCSVSVDFGSAARGTQRSFSVVAVRRTAPGSSSTVASAPSPAQTVTFPAASTPSGSPSGSPAGSGGGSTGATHGTSGGGGAGGGSDATGGSSGPTAHAGGGASHPVSGRHPAADLNASLPTVSAGAAPDLPSVLTEVKPLPQGTYKPVLPYGSQVKREAVHRPLTAPRAVLSDIAHVLDTSALWRGLAGAAVLLLIVGHLHAWVQRVEID